MNEWMNEWRILNPHSYRQQLCVKPYLMAVIYTTSHQEWDITLLSMSHTDHIHTKTPRRVTILFQIWRIFIKSLKQAIWWFSCLSRARTKFSSTLRIWTSQTWMRWALRLLGLCLMLYPTHTVTFVLTRAPNCSPRHDTDSTTTFSHSEHLIYTPILQQSSQSSFWQPYIHTNDSTNLWEIASLAIISSHWLASCGDLAYQEKQYN